MYGVLKRALARSKFAEDSQNIIKESITPNEDKLLADIIGDVEDNNPELNSLLDKIPVEVAPDVNLTPNDIKSVSGDVDPTVEELAESIIEGSMYKF